MTQLEVDPNLVQPGWTPLLVVLLLGVVLFLLGRSMLRQFGKIDVPADHPTATDEAGDAGHERPERPERPERSEAKEPPGPPAPDLRARTPRSPGSAGPGPT